MNETTDKKYDLEERTACFGESVIDLVKTIKKDSLNNPLVNQLIRSATSVGANYMEANQASSKKDFRNKIYICKKEVHETKHWLRMLARANQDKSVICRALWKEAQELTLIFSRIVTSINNTSKKAEN